MTESAAWVHVDEPSPRLGVDAPPAMRLPRAPVLGWASFRGARLPTPHCVDEVPHAVYTTSGRAALYQALKQLRLPPASRVLVATYHCPTMVAPILQAGAQPQFFPIRSDGLPDLDHIVIEPAELPRAMIVAHYFGLPRSLAKVRAWCDARSIALIEDCAHCLFGLAGERPVGGWGDFATASISKFLPVPEAGVLASSRRPVSPLNLTPRSVTEQFKGLLDVVEMGVRYRRLTGLDHVLHPLFEWKNRRNNASAQEANRSVDADGETTMRSCDMGRIAEAPLWVATRLARSLPRGQVVERRRRNFDQYARELRNAAGARPLFDACAEAVAPYVFPLWVDDADRVYHALRALGAPVFRWDRIWPGTPALAADQGPLWTRHVLQLLCHQDLDALDVARVTDAVRHLLHREAS